jgi:hypothetical protein
MAKKSKYFLKRSLAYETTFKEDRARETPAA